MSHPPLPPDVYIPSTVFAAFRHLPPIPSTMAANFFLSSPQDVVYITDIYNLLWLEPPFTSLLPHGLVYISAWVSIHVLHGRGNDGSVDHVRMN